MVKISKTGFSENTYLQGDFCVSGSTQGFMKTKEHGENIYKMMNASEAVAKRCKKGV